MQERNTYQDVPIEIIKRFVLNKIDELDQIQLSRVYETKGSYRMVFESDNDGCFEVTIKEK